MSDAPQTSAALFPLGQPLYPGVAMKLRIFEQRYLKLVRESMRTQTPFGVVPIVRGREVGAAPEFYPWGTLARIVDFDQQPDGLLGITIAGERRFQVLDARVEDDGLIVANLEPCGEEPRQPLAEDQGDLGQLLDELVAGLQVDHLFPAEPPTLAELSWRLATLLPLPGGVKISLLAEHDPRVRLEVLRTCLAEMATAQGGTTN